MHDRLFEHQHLLDERSLVRHALAVGVPDMERFVGDLKDHRYLAADATTWPAARSGVIGTPTFFVNAVRHDGGYDAASLMQALLAARDPRGSGVARDVSTEKEELAALATPDPVEAVLHSDTVRAESFSDAVLAIIITLLVLDLFPIEHERGKLLDALLRQAC